MGRFVAGADREQATLFPPCLEDWTADDKPVRVIDVAATTGRPGYHPTALPKLYVYAYLNRIPSSRRPLREEGRNVTKAKLQRRRERIGESVSRYLAQHGAADRREPTPERAAEGRGCQ